STNGPRLPVRSKRERQPSRKVIRSTSCSTTGAGSTGSRRTARRVSPPPQGLSRGNVALSRRTTRAPPRAGWIAVTDPAGPAPITATSYRGTPRRLLRRRAPQHSPDDRDHHEGGRNHADQQQYEDPPGRQPEREPDAA